MTTEDISTFGSQHLHTDFLDCMTRPEVRPAMSTPTTEDGTANMSTTKTTKTPKTRSTKPPRNTSHTPWVEPAAASQIAQKACAFENPRGIKKCFANYSPDYCTPRAGLTFKEVCSNYPNHLDGDLPLEMEDAGLTPRDIVEMMPADTRNPGIKLEWSFIKERTRKARMLRDNAEGTASHSATVKFEDSSHQANTTTSTQPVAKPPHSTSTMLTAGYQFSFEPSLPRMFSSATQYTDECHDKDALRSEIRNHLALLITISSSTDADFNSKNQQEKEHAVLLQWKQWCDDQALGLAKQHGIFVRPTLTGLVVKDSLVRLLGTLTMIHVNWDGRTTVEESDRSHALASTKMLCEQHTQFLQARVDQLSPWAADFLHAITTAASPSASAIPSATAHSSSAAQFSYAAQFSSAVQSSTAAQSSTTATPNPAPPPSTPLQEHQQPAIPHLIPACVSCRFSKKRCDRARPTCSHCVSRGRDCIYD